jgi:hypothetical protein
VRSIPVRPVRTVLLAIVIGLVGAAPARAAQELPAGGRNPRGGPPPAAAPAGGVTPAEIVRMFNAMELMRAQEVLQLRDDQYAPFIKALTGLQATRQRLENQRNRLMRELRSALQTTPSNDAAIAERLDGLRTHDDEATAAVRQAWDAIDKILDVRQRARFRVLEQEMERQQLDLVMRARGAARGTARGR